MNKDFILCFVFIFLLNLANAQYQWPDPGNIVTNNDANWGTLATTNTLFTLPAGVWDVFIECWGGGGGGGGGYASAGTNNRSSGGGGGGGAYSNKTLTNIAGGTQFYVTAGVRGVGGYTSTAPSNGGLSRVRQGSPSGTIVCEAAGGTASSNATGTGATGGGIGGSASAGVGDVRSSGGNGAAGIGGTGASARGGGGGGGGGNSNSGATSTSGVGGSGGATGGGNGGAGNTSTANYGGPGLWAAIGTTTNFGGGGGGGLSRNDYARQGRGGSPGVVKITLISKLGVQLSSFRAECDKAVSILWTTSSERNSDYFTLERSRNGQEWYLVETIKGAGTTNVENTYSYSDDVSGEAYYRLKQVDFDGKEQLYGPISVNCNSNKNSLIVFPNPSSGEFAVEINSGEVFEDAAIAVYDISGKQLLRQDININLKGTDIVYFTDNNLAPGTYFVVVESEAKTNLTPVKLVIR